MPDFLTRLVERARGTAPTARPLVAPSFSPATEPRPDRPQLVATDESVEAEAAGAPARHNAGRHRFPAPPDSRPLEEDAQLYGRDEDADTSSHAPRQTLPPLPISTPTRRTASQHTESAANAPTERATTRQRESQPATNVRVTEIELLMPRNDPATTPPPGRQPQPRSPSALDTRAPEVAAPQTPPPPSQPASTDHASSARVNADETSSRQSGQRDEPAASTNNVAPHVIHVNTVRREVISSSQNESSQAREPVVESPPTVHVSIGRVEVRAVAPQRPAAPRVETRPAPRMSLDEYLRAQSGRRG